MTVNGKNVTVKLPPKKTGPTATEHPSAYAFGIYKAGSTLLFDILNAACAASPYSYFSLNDVLFNEHGVELDHPKLQLGQNCSAELQRLFEHDVGYIFGGFRRFPRHYSLSALGTRKKLLLVRDPRDCIVSHYFSVKYSHAAPPDSTNEESRTIANAVDIAEYVTTDHVMLVFLRAFDSYKSLPPENLLVLKYEDYVFRKRELIDVVLDFLGIETSLDLRRAIRDQVDIIPTSDQPLEHVRHVKPGDHLDKLSQETVKTLTDAFREILDRYGYS